MSVTEFGNASPQNVNIWSKLLMREAIHKTFIRRFMGTDENAILQRLTDLEKNSGDTVFYDLLLQMAQYGVTGDNPIKGFEEALVYQQDTLLIDQRRLAHAFRRMSSQRTLHDLRRDGRRSISDRWATIYDEFMIAYLSGQAGTQSVGLAAALPHAGNALTAPDANHLIDHGFGAPGVADFTVDDIDECVERAKTLTPLIRPAKVDGEEVYVMLIHPAQTTALRTDTGASQWREITSLAGIRGRDNPLFSGALGRWGNVVIHETNRITRDAPAVASETTIRALFLGAQAGTIAWGNAYSKARQGSIGGDMMMSWYEQVDDYGNEQGIAAGSVFGVKATIFNAERFGMIALDTNTTPA